MGRILTEAGESLLDEADGKFLVESRLAPPVPYDWVSRYSPQPADFNTYIRDTFNFLASPPRARLIANTVQPGIAANTWTPVQLQNVLEDTYAGWNTGVTNFYQAPVAGCYGMTFLTYAAVPSGFVARVGLQFQIAGVTVGPYEYDQNVSDGSPWGWDCYDEIYLHEGDTVTPMFIHEYTTSVSTDVTFPSAFEITWLSL